MNLKIVQIENSASAELTGQARILAEQSLIFAEILLWSCSDFGFGSARQILGKHCIGLPPGGCIPIIHEAAPCVVETREASPASNSKQRSYLAWIKAKTDPGVTPGFALAAPSAYGSLPVSFQHQSVAHGKVAVSIPVVLRDAVRERTDRGFLNDRQPILSLPYEAKAWRRRPVHNQSRRIQNSPRPGCHKGNHRYPQRNGGEFRYVEELRGRIVFVPSALPVAAAFHPARCAKSWVTCHPNVQACELSVFIELLVACA